MSSLSPSPSTSTSESELEELRRIAVRLFESVANGVAPPLQDGDRVTFEIEELYCKDGTSPASKTAISALPAVTITAEEAVGDCAICLTEYVAGEEAKEMPCKHRYHSGCIEKWLGIHGSCPLCRYELPVEDEEEDKPVLVVSFSIQRGSDSGAPNRNDSDSDSDSDHDDSGDSLDSEDMEVDHNGSSMEDVD